MKTSEKLHQTKLLENPKMRRILFYFGGVAKVAKALKIKPQSIYQWDEIPEKRAYQIQLLSKGEIPVSYLLGKDRVL